jgi:membrane protease YdiL (CAAX protease family)
VARLVAAVSLYGALSLVSIIWLNEAELDVRWIGLLVQALACVGAGWFLRQWLWVALALAFIPTLLAEPFGDPEHVNEGDPIAIFELTLFPAYVALILLGAAARRAVCARHQDRQRGRQTGDRRDGPSP